MSNVFAENQYTIWEQKKELARLRNESDHLRQEDLDALTLVSEKFSPHDRPEEVIAYIMGEGAANEAAFQLQITTNALEKVNDVIRVLTAQNYLRPFLSKSETKNLLSCIASDEHQLGVMFAKAADSVRQLRESPHVQTGRVYANLDDEIELFVAPLFNDIANEYDDYVSGRLDPNYLMLGEEELIDATASLRLETVGHNLEANSLHLAKIKKSLDEATYILKARDENIIPATSGVQDFIDARMDHADKALARSAERLKAATAFMNEIFFMDDEAVSAESFKAHRYVATPLIKLFDNTP
jgi:hypothetical protein